ncbi:MAG: class I SAM-dependent methyltransferase, partial [Microbacteriaceae bacterium]|nr:class I SAM-dependent methyltransferase [Microbacteriaceae bacterium]
MQSKKPVGTITRGTTNPNRLRRVDRYISSQPALRMTS